MQVSDDTNGAGLSALTRLTLVLAAIASAGAALFVVVYPHIFTHIERAHPDRYQENVAEALAEGDLDKAIASASHAARWHSLDPKVYTTLGGLLAQDGQVEAARAQFLRAVGLISTPDYRPTRKPFFDSLARLGLGDLAKDVPVQTLFQYELARAYGTLGDEEFADFHRGLYDAYARHGLWGRALEFGLPDAAGLAALDTGSLQALARTAGASERWEIAGPAAAALVVLSPEDAESHFIVGRIHLATGQFEAARAALSKAVQGKHGDAPFFLGLLEQRASEPDAAVRAFRQTAPDSLYRAFALGRILELAAARSGPALSAVERERVTAEMAQCVTSACPIRVRPAPLVHRHTNYDLVAVSIPGAEAEGGMAFQVLTAWDRGMALRGPEEKVCVREGPRESFTLESAGSILNLQWVTNHVLLGSFGGLAQGTTEIPGWFEPERDWGGTGGGDAAIAQDKDVNGFLRIKNSSGEGFPRVKTAPTLLHTGAGYLLIGRVRAPATKAVLGWEFLDREGRTAAGHNTFNQVASPIWAWRGAYTRASVLWESAWIVAGVYPEAGEADFDDLMLIELSDPDGAVRTTF